MSDRMPTASGPRPRPIRLIVNSRMAEVVARAVRRHDRLADGVDRTVPERAEQAVDHQIQRATEADGTLTAMM